MPKSSTFTSSSVCPSTVARKMFAGLRSRCTTPCACASASADDDRVDDAGDGRQRQRPGAQARLQVAPLEVLHDEVGPRVGRDVEVEDLDDVRMAQLRHDLRLAAEARERVLVSLKLGEQQLHRELPGKADVLRHVDLAHRAPADAAAEHVAVAQNDVRVRAPGT